jgi:hypothetical protein
MPRIYNILSFHVPRAASLVTQIFSFVYGKRQRGGYRVAILDQQ